MTWNNMPTRSGYWRQNIIPGLQTPFYYFKKYASRKDINILFDLSYGFRNNDLNGAIQLKRMYNPFNRGFYQVELVRDFDHIYEGDAWINQIQRSSYFLNNYFDRVTWILQKE